MEELKKEQDKYVTKVFWLGLQTSLIFGLPALLAVFLGRKLDSWYDSGKLIMIIMLCFAFVLSWTLVLMQYHRLNKKLKEISGAIKENRSND